MSHRTLPNVKVYFVMKVASATCRDVFIIVSMI